MVVRTVTRRLWTRRKDDNRRMIGHEQQTGGRKPLRRSALRVRVTHELRLGRRASRRLGRQKRQHGSNLTQTRRPNPSPAYLHTRQKLQPRLSPSRQPLLLLLPQQRKQPRPLLSCDGTPLPPPPPPSSPPSRSPHSRASPPISTQWGAPPRANSSSCAIRPNVRSGMNF